jgi:hypothetical protein
MAFLPNKNNLPEINHKDGNKNNNHVSNLEWCTSQQNKEHAVRYGLRPISDKMRETSRKLAYKLHKRLTHLDYVKIGQKSRETLMNKSTQERNKSKMLVWKPIKCIELNKIFCCAKRVKEKLGYNERTITRAIGKSVKAYGFTWKYISNRRFPKSLINSSI